MARTFLLNAQEKDANLTIREFEVDQSLPNTLLLGRLYEMIGLPEFWVVPVAVIVTTSSLDISTTRRPGRRSWATLPNAERPAARTR
jgi:hypothetical protein